MKELNKNGQDKKEKLEHYWKLAQNSPKQDLSRGTRLSFSCLQ